MHRLKADLISSHTDLDLAVDSMRAPLSAPPMATLQSHKGHRRQLPPELRWRRASSYPDSNSLARLDLECRLGLLECCTATSASSESDIIARPHALEPLKEQASSPITIPCPKPRTPVSSHLRTSHSFTHGDHEDYSIARPYHGDHYTSASPIISPESGSPIGHFYGTASPISGEFDASFPHELSADIVHAEDPLVGLTRILARRPGLAVGRRRNSNSSKKALGFVPSLGSPHSIRIDEETDSEAELSECDPAVSTMRSSLSCPQLDVENTQKLGGREWWQLDRSSRTRHSYPRSGRGPSALARGAHSRRTMSMPHVLPTTVEVDSALPHGGGSSSEDLLEDAAILIRVPSPETEENARRFQEALSDIKRRSVHAVIPEYCLV